MGCCDQPGLLPLAQALEQMQLILSDVLEIETIPLAMAYDRVLAQDITSPINVPSFNNSAMDGYALRHQDLTTPGQQLPLSGRIYAGDSDIEALIPGTCMRIMTGAPMPNGADTVVMQEETNADNDAITFNQLARLGQNVRYKGSELKVSDFALGKGVRLKPAQIALLANLGIAEVQVKRLLKVAFFSTGDELQALGKPLASGQIYDSNRYAVAALLTSLPCELIDMGVIPDDLELLRSAFRLADQQADLVISSGGVSVGEADFTKQVLDEQGEINFWKLAIKPGKPLAFGQLDNSVFLGLPGNPVSALVTLYKVGVPCIAALCGWNYQSALTSPAICDDSLSKRPGRQDFQRGVAYLDDTGQLRVRTTGAQGSALPTSLSSGNCFVVLENERASVSPGETVQVELFKGILED
ncbi:molybdopterin molybdotransferase [Alginatibacterium sediminis]|uniref:Molybdopterin molybdenumtransferase n=1 Tax=Alginatibacterium sediminis TaxID=2164068 RepID=A0A420EHD9_9ALTE|nr:molybdopterin molybdotransferase MoeA [Alginatibacterium sediminis]RKF20151.1 molybdopterin molybdotransferase [Alginatibacterium sediminis]